MKNIIPPKLKSGDEIRIVAPSCSATTIKKSVLKDAKKILEGLGFKVTYSKNLFEVNEFETSSVKSRVKDLHDAFRDKNVKGILAVRGGFNINDLLDYLDYDLIKRNPKVYCGFSDNTALQNAIYTRTGLVTYSGPNFASFSRPKNPSYTLNNFLNAVVAVKSEPLKNLDKPVVINKGKVSGEIVGGNLCTFNLLQGTKYMPSLSGKIIFIEDDNVSELDLVEFYRNLQSLIHQTDFKKAKGLVFGIFQPASKITTEKIRTIVKLKQELKGIPVIANLNFGHDYPMFTFPVGGRATIDTSKAMPLQLKF